MIRIDDTISMPPIESTIRAPDILREMVPGTDSILIERRDYRTFYHAAYRLKMRLVKKCEGDGFRVWRAS